MGAGDANTGAGYGSLKVPQLGNNSEAEQSWPYVVLTPLEKLADALPDDDVEDSQAARKKKSKQKNSVDTLDQLNYRSHSFVNGSTRGLMGIMSGAEPHPIIERPLKRKPAGGIFGQKPIGSGGIQPDTMHPSALVRTRPGQTMGSKQGWFSPHPPKPTDPSQSLRITSLKDLADNEEEIPMLNAEIEANRNKKSNMTERKIELLRSYLRIVFWSP